MIPYELMAGAFYVMVGVVCTAVTIMVILGVIAGFRRAFGRQNKKDRTDTK